MEDNDLWSEAQRKKEAQAEREAEFLAAMIALWLLTVQQMQSMITVIAEQAAQAAGNGKPLNLDQVRNLEASKLLILQALSAADDTAGQWVERIEAEQRRAQADASTDAGDLITIAMIMAGLIAVIGGGFQVPGGLATGSPGSLLTGEALRTALLSRVGAFIESAISAIATGATAGQPVPAIVTAAVDQLAKLGDVAAIIGSDQAALAYREALLAAYDSASSKIPIIGYRRVSKRDKGVCPACIALDGKFYKLGEHFSEHPRGRCIGVPVMKGQDDQAWPTGIGWIAKQPPEVQKSILGKGRWEAWKRGEFDLDDLAKVVDGPLGPTLQSTPLKELTDKK